MKHISKSLDTRVDLISWNHCVHNTLHPNIYQFISFSFFNVSVMQGCTLEQDQPQWSIHTSKTKKSYEGASGTSSNDIHEIKPQALILWLQFAFVLFYLSFSTKSLSRANFLAFLRFCLIFLLFILSRKFFIHFIRWVYFFLPWNFKILTFSPCRFHFIELGFICSSSILTDERSLG